MVLIRLNTLLISQRIISRSGKMVIMVIRKITNQFYRLVPILYEPPGGARRPASITLNSENLWGKPRIHNKGFGIHRWQLFGFTRVKNVYRYKISYLQE